jgi:hypothetical protein
MSRHIVLTAIVTAIAIGLVISAIDTVSIVKATNGTNGGHGKNHQ